MFGSLLTCTFYPGWLYPLECSAFQTAKNSLQCPLISAFITDSITMTHVFSMLLVLEMFIQTQVSCLICLIHLLGNNTGPYYIFPKKKNKTKIKHRNKPRSVWSLQNKTWPLKCMLYTYTYYVLKQFWLFKITGNQNGILNYYQVTWAIDVLP